VEVLRKGVYFGVAAATGKQPSPHVTTVLEAEAVAYEEFGRASIQGIPRLRGSALIVDAGAGTTDATIVRIESDASLSVVAHAGLPVGGIDLDAYIANLGDMLRRGTSPERRLGVLRNAQELKERLWSAQAGTGVNAGEKAPRVDEFADELSDKEYPAEHRPGQTLGEALEVGHRRYMGLAVHALLRGLPDMALKGVTRVVLSGRASMLAGFREAVENALKDRIDADAEITAAGEHMDDPDTARKLAVVRGVATFADRDFFRSRRPVLSTSELVLDHPMSEQQATVLLPVGHPLDQGWAVAAFHEPRGDRPRTVRRRMVSREVLQALVEGEYFSDRGEDADRLLSWSSTSLARFPVRPPYAGKVAFDVFTQTVLCEVDGKPYRSMSLDPGTHSGGDRHPVHGLAENWFEQLLRRGGT
jgi:hypothetical protein